VISKLFFDLDDSIQIARETMPEEEHAFDFVVLKNKPTQWVLIRVQENAAVASWPA
jgi:hypothetical protein